MDRTLENAEWLDRVAAGDKAAESELVKNNMGLVKSIAARFLGRGQDMEDLVQIGSMGLLKAARGYDPAFGTAFSTYAVPLISGEIKRFLRDDGLIKVGRDAKRNYARLMRAREELTARSGSEPRLEELCEACEMKKEDAVYALEACGQTVSLQEKIGDGDGAAWEDVCADAGIGDVTERIALREAVSGLEERERILIFLRYFRGLTQNEVARRLGMTQVKVSRTEKKIMAKLAEKLEET